MNIAKFLMFRSEVGKVYLSTYIYRYRSGRIAKY